MSSRPNNDSHLPEQPPPLHPGAGRREVADARTKKADPADVNADWPASDLPPDPVDRLTTRESARGSEPPSFRRLIVAASIWAGAFLIIALLLPKAFTSQQPYFLSLGLLMIFVPAVSSAMTLRIGRPAKGSMEIAIETLAVTIGGMMITILACMLAGVVGLASAVSEHLMIGAVVLSIPALIAGFLGGLAVGLFTSALDHL